MRKLKKQPKFFEEPELIKGNSCSIFTVMLILFLVLTIVMGGLFYLKILSKGEYSIKFPSAGQKEEVVKPVSERIAEVNSDEKIDIRLEQSELTSLIREIPEFPLKNPQAKINLESVILSGKTSNNFLSLNVQVYLRPVLMEGRLGWEIESIKTGDVIAPKQLSELISKNLLPESFMPGGEKIVVERADLFDGYLLVVGIKK